MVFLWWDEAAVKQRKARNYQRNDNQRRDHHPRGIALFGGRNGGGRGGRRFGDGFLGPGGQRGEQRQARSPGARRKFICERHNFPLRHYRAASPVSPVRMRSEEHTSELQSLMRISYAVFCLNKKTEP